MITGKLRKIKQYLLIDHCGEGYYWCRPKEEGEEIYGVPYQWYAEQSFPFIEHIVGGKVIKTVNALDVSIIEFDEQCKSYKGTGPNHYPDRVSCWERWDREVWEKGRGYHANKNKHCKR